MSRNISMRRPGDWDNFPGSQNTEVPPELGDWITADGGELSETARQMYAWREEHGGKGLGYASYDAQTNGAFGQTDISAASYTEANHVVRWDDLFAGYEEIFDEEGDLREVLPDPSEIIFRLEDIGFFREQIIQILAIKVMQGIQNPDLFCTHACEGHGEAVVSETCAMIEESIRAGNFALTPVHPKTVSKMKAQRGITGYRRLELSPKEPIWVSDGPYSLPIILATILKYDPTIIEHCNFALPEDVLPEVLLASSALAGLTSEEVFRPTKKDKGKLRRAKTDLTRVFKGREFGYFKAMYTDMLEVCSPRNIDPNEKLALMQRYFDSCGYETTELPIFGVCPGVGRLGVMPKVIFNNFFEGIRLNKPRGLSEKEIERMERYCVGMDESGNPVYDFFTGNPVTAFSQIVVVNKRKEEGSGYDLLDILRADGFIY